MPARKITFTNEEIYHCYNRGVDKRSIFEDTSDLERFVQGMIEFNTVEPIGSLYENSFLKNHSSSLGSPASKSVLIVSESRLVSLINFCLNPNHFHFCLRQVSDRGVERFMQRIGTGYTKYFNNKYKRSGALFQGRFKSSWVSDNTQLLHLSAYINLNDRVHSLGSPSSKSVGGEEKKLVPSWTSYSEYGGGEPGSAQKLFGNICEPEVVLGQFSNTGEYKQFAEEALELSLAVKMEKKELDFHGCE